MNALNINLRPLFDSKGAAQVIDITMAFSTCAKAKGDVLFHHTLKRGNVPTSQLTTQSVRLTNSDKSPIEMYTIDTKQGTHREFRIGEDGPVGGILIVQYQATPRQVNEYTSCGPAIAIEKDNGGLSGAGLSFLLIPAADDDVNSNIMQDIVIEWDLSLAPSAARAVCTFGEGQRLNVHERLSILSECFFAVGPLKSYPAAAAAVIDAPFRMYWLSEPPFNAHALGEQLQKLVPRMAKFFGDDEKLFQVFIRRNEYKRASGRGLHQGFVFSWTTLCQKDEDTVQDFLLHEIVHNWPSLGFTTGGPEDLIDGWFNEGIAEYYSLILPYVFGILTEDQFIQRFNWRLSGYYTNPDRAVPNKDVQGQFWLPGRVHRIPYQRGFMYFVQLAYNLHNSGKRPLDELVREMIRLRAANQPHGIGVWLSLVEKELGPNALDDYKDMSNANQIILPSDVVGV